MKKKLIPLIIAIIIILGSICLIPYLLRSDETEKTTMNWKLDYTVENGVITKDNLPIAFNIDKDGEYIIEYYWVPEGEDHEDILSVDTSKVKALTSIRISDSEVNNVFGTSGGALSASTTNYLTKGEYELKLTQFVDRESFVEYAKEYLCANADAEEWADGYDFSTVAQNGDYTMEYGFSYRPVSASNSNNLLYFAIVILFTIAVIIILVIIANNGEYRAKYDERQILEQGKAFKFGFFSTIIAIGVIGAADAFGIVSMIDTTVLYCSAIFIGLGVYVVYCVWHEAYFGINQQSVSVMVMLAIIGLANTTLSIMGFVSGQMVVNGIVTFRIMNVLCAALFFALFITILIKKLSLSKTSEEDEDEDDDDEDAVESSVDSSVEGNGSAGNNVGL